MVNNDRYRVVSRGFTIVELMFALVFIAFILLFTTFAVIEIVKQYNRGIELKSISQSGRNIIDMIVRDVSMSNTLTREGSSTGVGMLCAGGVTYAWNGIDSPPVGDAARNSYNGDATIRLSLVRTKVGCNSTGKSDTIPKPDAAGGFVTSELLTPQVQVLDINLETIQPSLHRLHITLGTSRTDAYVDEGGVKVCKSDEICAKKTFSTTVKTLP